MRGKSLVATKVVHDLTDAWREEGVPLEAALLQGVEHPGVVQVCVSRTASTICSGKRGWRWGGGRGYAFMNCLAGGGKGGGTGAC